MGRAKRTARDSGEQRRGRAWVRGVWVVGVYLCWGVGLTWAVAWGVAWGAAPADQLREDSVIEDGHQPERLAHVLSGFGVTEVFVYGYAGQELVWVYGNQRSPLSELPWFAEHAVPVLYDAPVAGPFLVAAYGWPWSALALERWEQDSSANRALVQTVLGADLRGVVVVPGGRLRGEGAFSHDDLWLPLLPLWRGLIANTVFYAVLMWCARRGFVLVRGRRRRRRGRCWVRGGCGYDLTGLDSATCPECGRPVAPT